MIWIFMESEGDEIKSKQASKKDRTLGIILLVHKVAAAIFVRWKKVPDFGTSERFSINSLNLKTNFGLAVVEFKALNFEKV